MGRSVEAAQPIHPLGSFSLSILPFYSSPLLQVFSFRSPRSSRSIVLSFYLSRSAVRGLSSFHASIQSCNHAFFFLILTLKRNFLHPILRHRPLPGCHKGAECVRKPGGFLKRSISHRLYDQACQERVSTAGGIHHVNSLPRCLGHMVPGRHNTSGRPQSQGCPFQRVRV
jgi:hypothetical protein